MAANRIENDNLIEDERSGWLGWVYFSGFLMIILGFFQIIAGLAALLNDQYFVALRAHLLVLDYTQWGWIHLILGIVILMAGLSLFNGSTWARIVGVWLAMVNLVAQFAFVSVYPIWSILMMVLDVIIIYSLTVHGGELKSDV
jgi:hypothetical protein